MNNIHQIDNEYAKTSSGSINYQHYDNRARSIRSDSVLKLIADFFIDKKSSSIDNSKKYDVVPLKNQDEQKKQFNLINEAA